MKGSDAIIEFLNEALTAELTAVNQYFAHAKLCENWGYGRPGGLLPQRSRIEEMNDAETLMDRILLLDGMPNLQRLGTVRVGETVEEAAPARPPNSRQAAIEMIPAWCRARARRRAMPAPARCSSGLVVGEEEHLDWIETQLHAIGEIGIERYLQSHLSA